MLPPADEPRSAPLPHPHSMVPAPSEPTLPATTQPISPALLAEAVRRTERERSKRRWGRRALLGVVGVGACCALAEVAPVAIRDVGLYTQKQLDQALQDGITQGREAVLAELRNLEGVALADAITVADLTRRGVSNYVKPLADMTASIAGGSLGALASVIGFARDHVPNATVFGLNVHDALGNLATLFASWDAEVASDPLASYALQDVTKAEAYLKALQNTIYGASNGSAATPTTGS